MRRTDVVHQIQPSRASALFTLFTFFTLVLTAARPAHAQVPAVVFSQANGEEGISSAAGVTPADYGGTTGHIAANSRGDVFANVSANGGAYVEEIAAIGGKQTALITGEGSLYGGHAVYVDAHNNVWATDTGDASILYIPFVNNGYPPATAYSSLTNCKAFPVPATQTTDCIVPFNYPGSIGGYGQGADIALDAAGNVYILFKYTGNGSSYPGADVLLKFSATDGSAIDIGGSLQNDAYGELAVSPLGDAFVETYGSVVEFPHTNYSQSIPLINLNGPDGVSTDASGNLFITNNSSANILEYPFVNGTYNLPNAPVSIVSNQLSTPYSTKPSNGIAIDGSGRITMSGNYPNSISTLTVGSLSFGNTPIATTTGALTLNMVFNSAQTFGGFKFVGPFAASTAALPTGDTACNPGNYAAGGNCSVNITYTATTPGTQLGQIVALDNTGAVLGTATLSGIGVAATINADPGSNVNAGSGYAAPSAVAVDNAGDIFVADSTNGTIYKTATGATAATPVATGFTAPSAVAVDGAGNLYVAETGQIVELPLNPSTSTYGTTPAILFTGTSGPSGLALDSLGELLVADSGNSRVLRLGSSGNLPVGSLVTTVGSNFNKPVAVAVDNSSNNVYVADAGSGSVYQVNHTTSAQATVLSGLTAVSGIAVDPSGSLYAVDAGSSSVIRLPFINGGVNPNFQTTLAPIVKLPNAIAADSTGNLYVVDTTDAIVATDNRSAGSLPFGNITVGQTSSVIAGQVSNSGNASLTLATPDYTESGATSSFAIQSSSTCAPAGTLTGGQSCTIAATFMPQTYGPLTDTLTLGSNAANAATLALTGVGTPVLINTTLNLAVSSTGTPTFGKPVTITATLVPASQAASAPTGQITFYVDNVAQPAQNLNAAGTGASITLTKLTGGTHNITASYTGDFFYSSTSSAPLTLSVALLGTTTSMSITAPDVNPTSANPATPTLAQNVLLTAIVVPAIPGTPTGVVNFYNGTTLLGTAPVNPYDPSGKGTMPEGQATLTVNTQTAPLALGQYEITATYTGDSNYTGSASTTPVPLLISNPTVLIVPSATTIIGGGPAINLTISSVAGFSATSDLSCSGLPLYAACAFSPTYAVISPGQPASVNLQVVINQPPVIPVKAGFGSANLPGHRTLALFLTTFLLLPSVFFAWSRRNARTLNSRFSVMRLSGIACFLLLTGLAAALSGCGTTTASDLTPAGTTTITLNALITAPSAGGATPVPDPNPTPTATLQLQLVVPQQSQQ